MLSGWYSWYYWNIWTNFLSNPLHYPPKPCKNMLKCLNSFCGHIASYKIIHCEMGWIPISSLKERIFLTLIVWWIYIVPALFLHKKGGLAVWNLLTFPNSLQTFRKSKPLHSSPASLGLNEQTYNCKSSWNTECIVVSKGLKLLFHRTFYFRWMKTEPWKLLHLSYQSIHNLNTLIMSIS